MLHLKLLEQKSKLVSSLPDKETSVFAKRHYLERDVQSTGLAFATVMTKLVRYVLTAVKVVNFWL